jgi:hypothetical protein
MTNDKNKADKKQNRRDFLKVAGAAGAAVAMGAVLGPQQVQSQPRPGAFCLEPKNGFLAPTPEVAKALIERLQEDLNKDPILRAKYLDNPKAVMGERGFGVDLTREVLTAHGWPMPFRAPSECWFTCIITNCGRTIVIGVRTP